MKVHVAESRLEDDNILVSILVNFVFRLARYFRFVILASLDGPSHPRIVGIVVIVEELVILSEIRAVVLPIVVHVLHALRQELVVATHERHPDTFVHAILICVNEHLHLQIGVPVVVVVLV